MIINLALCQTANNAAPTNTITDYREQKWNRKKVRCVVLWPQKVKKSMRNHRYVAVRVLGDDKKTALFCVWFGLVWFCFVIFVFQSCVCVCVSRPIFVNWCSMRSTLMLAEKKFQRHCRCYCCYCRQYCCRHLMLCRTRRTANHTQTHVYSTGWRKAKKENTVWSSFSWTRSLFGWARIDENSSFVHRDVHFKIRSHNVWELIFETETTVGTLKYTPQTNVDIKHARTHPFLALCAATQFEYRNWGNEQTNTNEFYTCDIWRSGA